MTTPTDMRAAQAARPGSEILGFDGVGVTYPNGTRALDGVDLRIRAGEFVKFGPLMRQYIEQGRIGGEGVGAVVELNLAAVACGFGCSSTAAARRSPAARLADLKRAGIEAEGAEFYVVRAGACC